MAADDLMGMTGELERLRTEVARLSEDLTASRQREAALQDQVTATASILRTIASGPADVPAVLQAIVENATKLCQVDNGTLFGIDGDEMVRMANLMQSVRPQPVGMRIPFGRGSWAGRAVLERRTMHHVDAEATLDEYPISAQPYRERMQRHGDSAYRVRSLLIVPLLREGTALGTLNVSRSEVRPFTEAEIALLESFADQAVIAIENARLFQEIQESNRQVTAALEQQTVTAEVLRVIASSPTDLD